MIIPQIPHVCEHELAFIEKRHVADPIFINSSLIIINQVDERKKKLSQYWIGIVLVRDEPKPLSRHHHHHPRINNLKAFQNAVHCFKSTTISVDAGSVR